MNAEANDARRLVLVVGVGRSGTSVLTGVLGQLGFHVPQPEVTADDTNPRGFGEPRWVVDFHTRLLRARNVTVNDARPTAWETTNAAADDDAARAELSAWLAGEFEAGSEVVVKDPRTSWFLPLWTRCARDLGVEPLFVTMLRHPAEILASARKSYGTRLTMATRAAAWLNVMLETERSTRGASRAFVRYEDLLDDWRREVKRVGSVVDLPLLADPEPARAERVDGFVDPSLHRNRVRWDEFDVPPGLERLADSVWQDLLPLADRGGDADGVHAKLDEARGAYARLYADAEAIAQSSVNAARRGRRRRGGSPSAPAPDAAPSLRARVARRVPARYRRRLRRAVRSLSGS